MENNHLHIEQTTNFQVISCNQGHYITSWKEGDPLEHFSASKKAYCPLLLDPTTIFHCITDEEYANLMEQKKNTYKRNMVPEMINADNEVIENHHEMQQ